RIVSMSHSDWVGCHSSVSPFHTGTPAYLASVSAVAWLKPRYSIPSYIRPRTRAVSAADSLWPRCDPDGSRYVTWAPWSWAATSKAHRVRVEAFSNTRAMLAPRRCWTSVPARLAAFSRAARASSDRHSPGVW